MTRTEAIKAFLTARSLPDLAAAYNYGMEVQVNVAQDGGERYDGEYRGKQFTAWTDGEQVWKSFRIPWKAATEPKYNDGPIRFDLAEHAEAIGMTGWNWERRESVYVVYDFDSILNHKVGLSDSELYNLRQVACEIPWVSVRRSTSGSGLHIYVYLNPVVPTENHTEHAALARAILAKMSGEVGYDFNGAVDAVGGNIWIWARKYEASKVNGPEPGLELIKEGIPLASVPVNWRDHVAVAKRMKGKTVPHFVKDEEEGAFNEVCGKHTAVGLEPAHKALMRELDNCGALWWWDSDRHMLVCHTADLALVSTRMDFRGVFQTLAQGKERGTDQNAFAFPLPDGAWVVRRHTKNVQEAPTWDTDSSNWTRCYFNRLPEFTVAMEASGGLENEKHGYVFDIESAAEAIKRLGGEVVFPPEFYGRSVTVARHKNDGRKLVVTVPKSDIDKDISDWLLKGKLWMKVISTISDDRPDTVTFDDIVRHLVAESNSDAGWVLKGADSVWVEEPIGHIRLALKAQGHSGTDTDQIMGSGVMNRWKLTNTPFEVEYPGNKVWNRDGVQFAVTPSLDLEECRHPTWDSILDHVGTGLNDIISQDPWCQKNGVIKGADYLKLWIASIFQEPDQPLPYLFLYGPQGSGKSILHESISLLLTGGVVRADGALTNQNGFNAEIANAILCVIEETDLRRDKTSTYNRLKDWTVSGTISIHEKGKTPYLAKNYSHWLHCSNDIEALPIFPGDTRVTMVYVGLLPENEYIAKKALMKKLKEEASDFLGTILSMSLPETQDRLNIPVLITPDKLIAEQTNQNELEAFISETCHYTPGYGMPWKEFYEMFQEWLDPTNRPLWSKRRTGQLLPTKFCKGRYSSDSSQYWIGNISFRPLAGQEETPLPCRVVGEKIINLVGIVP